MSIKGKQYELISNNLGKSNKVNYDIAFSIGNVLSVFISNNLRTSNIEKQILMRAISDTYFTLIGEYSVLSDQLKSMVIALQEHVLKEYESIDSFLSANNLTVTQDFASLSSSLGYPISDEFIE